jgi:hypothetical protein
MNRIVALIALAAVALVGLDVIFRAEKHVGTSADRVARGRGLPLEALSHRLLPQLENARAYRLIGFFIIIFAAAFAAEILTGILGE